MYENIKYEELKQLPDEQKKEALQELMTIYGSNKAIAEAIGGSTIAIINMYKKYVLGESVGRVKGSKNSTKQEETLPDTIVETPTNEIETKPKRKYTRKAKDVEVPQETQIEQEEPKQEIVRTPIKLAELSVSFTTSLCGNLSGEEIKKRVAGMINSLLDDKTYTINLQIDEQ